MNNQKLSLIEKREQLHKLISNLDEEVLDKLIEEYSIESSEKILGNVCIAKFMGICPFKGISEYSGKEYYYHNNELIGGHEALPDYSNDWNSLISVVEKINERDWVTIYSDECKIHSITIGEFETINIINEGEPLIKSVFEAVLKYVEWYQSNFSY